MKRIAVFIENYNIDYNASIVNLIDFLSACCRIDLYLRNVQMKNSPVLRKAAIRIIEIRLPLHWRTLPDFVRLRLANLCRGQWRNAFLPARSPRAVSRRMAHQDYHGHIAFDQPGMTLCKELFPLARPFYYSLELALSSEAGGLSPDERLVREPAHLWGTDIRGLIIQSPERERLFRNNHPLIAATPVLHLPVTGTGPAVAERLTSLQQQYAVPARARIAIHLGGANPYYSSLPIAETFSAIENWYLFFQGNHLRGYGESIRRMAEERWARNIIVLKKFYSDLDSLAHILMSCHVGIAWYNDINDNFRSAGQSSGKITAYLKFGLPVIANRYPSTEEAIAKPGCGICVASLAEIPAALNRIAANYETFSTNARREYERNYRFEDYRRPLLHFLGLEYDKKLQQNSDQRRNAPGNTHRS